MAKHRLHRCTTEFWSVAWKRAKASAAASSSPTRPKRSRSRAKSSRSARASRTTRARYSRSTSRPATRILFGKYSGTEIKLDGEEFLIMREEEVLGILKK